MIPDTIGKVWYKFSFVKSCITCQRVNKKLHRMPAKLHPITVDGPWHRIGIDLIGPLPITAANKQKHIK